jgi:hypothetical protein
VETTKQLKALERKLRASKVYQDWVERNRAAWCFRCNSDQKLECHHIISLYHTLLGIWNLYGDPTETLEHATAMHSDDRVECVTLCHKCHGKRHPGRIAVSSTTELRVHEWAAIPRVFWFDLAHSTKNQNKDALGLVGLQTLFGLGWYVISGRIDGNMVEFNRRRFAELLGKKPGTSFNKSLDKALRTLARLDVLAGKHRAGNHVEVHLSPAYMERLKVNPWFFPLEDIQTDSMCVLMLRWFLSHQCRRKFYRISLDKLRDNLGIQTDRPSMVLKTLQSACEHIPWTDLTYDKGTCHFELRRKSATPVFTLRQILADGLAQ